MTDQILQIHMGSGSNQILQIQSTVKRFIFIIHIYRIYIVIVFSLRNQLLHGFLHSHTLANRDKVCGHFTTDFILFIGLNQSDIVHTFLINEAYQLLSNLFINIFQDVYRIIGVHVFDDFRSLFQLNFFEILRGILQIGENFRNTLDSQCGI